MQPIQELLHRIKWDAEFGKGEFALGYYDRVAREEKIVPFASVHLDPQRPSTFSFRDVSDDNAGDDADRTVRHIPLHRVRTVYKDGIAIWQRPGHPDGD